MTTTLEQQLEELKAKHAREIEHVTRKQEIFSALPEDLHVYEPRVFLHELFGSTGSLTITYDFFRYSFNKDKPQVSLDTVLRLAQVFPYHQPLALVSDGCVSVRTKSHVDTTPEERRERWTVTDIAPFEVRVSGFQKYSAEFRWHTNVLGKVLEMRVELPIPATLGRLDIAYQHQPDSCGCRGRVIRNNFITTDRVAYIRDEDGIPIATLHRTINYGSGSPDTPGEKLLLWTPIGNNRPARIEDLIRTLQEEK